MRKEVDRINAIPSKRLYLSIIADYDLNRSICELIDNVIDIWIKNGEDFSVNVDIILDNDQQTIKIIDDAGGIKKSDLKVIIAPGHTGNLPTEESIGIFGVGSKRAVVALAQDIKIVTRHKNEEQTYSIEYDDRWLEDESWELPIYEVDQIDPGKTVIQLQRLRFKITEEGINRLRNHLSATYAFFLKNNNFNLKVNGKELNPFTFDNWAYPPSYPPRKYKGEIKTKDGKKVEVEIIGGLVQEASPAGGEYGVYFYCNNRLIARALKSYEVGFTKGIAGLPHPSVSTMRVIIKIKGEAQLMPWNSSKSGINYNHPISISLRDRLLEIVKYYASLSRRLEGQWPDKVFKYKSGTIIEEQVGEFPKAKIYLSPLPKSKPRYSDKIKELNKEPSKKKPWIKGLYESIIVADLIYKQKLEQKNRITLIILDSTLEIAFKEYLVNELKERISDEKLKNLFKNRHQVHAEIKKYIKLDEEIWKKVEYYYDIRCKLIHQRATLTPDDSQIEDFREVVEDILTKLFGIKFHGDE